MQLTIQDTEFYQEIYPWLNDGEWYRTGAGAYGLVWWRSNEWMTEGYGIQFKASVGFVKSPNSGYFFVQLRWYGLLATTRLSLDEKSVTAQIMQAANETIPLLLKENEQPILDKIRELKEIKGA